MIFDADCPATPDPGEYYRDQLYHQSVGWKEAGIILRILKPCLAQESTVSTPESCL